MELSRDEIKNTYVNYAKARGEVVPKEVLSDRFEYFIVRFFGYKVYDLITSTDYSDYASVLDPMRDYMIGSNPHCGETVILIYSVEDAKNVHIISMATSKPHTLPYGC